MAGHFPAVKPQPQSLSLCMHCTLSLAQSLQHALLGVCNFKMLIPTTTCQVFENAPAKCLGIPQQRMSRHVDLAHPQPINLNPTSIHSCLADLHFSAFCDCSGTQSWHSKMSVNPASIRPPNRHISSCTQTQHHTQRLTRHPNSANITGTFKLYSSNSDLRF